MMQFLACRRPQQDVAHLRSVAVRHHQLMPHRHHLREMGAGFMRGRALLMDETLLSRRNERVAADCQHDLFHHLPPRVVDAAPQTVTAGAIVVPFPVDCQGARGRGCWSVARKCAMLPP